ncbi:MAG: hypothetical protein D8M57_10005 [Candidatus Scalindua sp. AMX11]|nr:MAG: hypothetical protein DWQ00_08755 [Candidatus Scalindua sp.]NOG84860.1 hypothetical protein [Planctomycetota bacterium]RZV84930.1 MAG: hypothetical protein EX341_07940 [Candidatus Scalindua sp. SCAELEC01]TDE65078.1 MAG: hypothetical protein D8M57_10005 [Candidatus Scalindua sp. AMX11]GJQ59471.1 MAG: hypothetical protein SCALA701_22720 [Candidatus Scalindua sp.]
MQAFTLSKKLYITFFLILIGIAFGVSCLSFYERTGFSPSLTVRHYNGNDETVNDDVEYEYNEPLLQEKLFFPKSYREILEIVHVHAFMIPLIIFVLSRILSLTDIRDGVKTTIYSIAFVGTGMNLSSIYLIRYKPEIFSLSLLASYIVLGLCFTTYISMPIWVMWFKKATKDVEYWL